MRLDETGVLHDPLVHDAEEDDRLMWLDVLYGDEATSQYSQSQRYQALLNDIAGGDYWQTIVQDRTIRWEEKCSILVDKYRQKLRDWFKLAEALPVYPDISAIPKYWIAFLSRYEPAFDLFNRAACNMNRAQRQNFRNLPDALFAGMEAQPEAALPQTVDRAVKRARNHSPLPGGMNFAGLRVEIETSASSPIAKWINLSRGC